jgi:hypothetical protein
VPKDLVVTGVVKHDGTWVGEGHETNELSKVDDKVADRLIAAGVAVEKEDEKKTSARKKDTDK